MDVDTSVRFTHRRLYRDYAGFSHIIANRFDAQQMGLDHTHLIQRGGETLCQILGKDGSVLSEGIAVCSEKDNFSKRIGRAISFGRAMKALN